MNSPPSLPGISTPCTGCGLCASVCPQGCITISESDEGFLKPVINAQDCIRCGACLNLCKKQERTCKTEVFCESYEFKVKNTADRYAASSGGFCTELSRHIIRAGGVVYGVTLTQDFRARFIEVDTEEALTQLRGSKYAQADTSGCFQQISVRLKQKRTVLFIGTACQVKALRTKFGYSCNHLLSVDIACYGVPSYLLLDAYIRERNAGNDKLIHLSFKNKQRGWRNNSLHLIFESGNEIISPAGTDPFIQGFDTRLCLNKACYTCKRNISDRLSDITCADYWGHKDKENDDSSLGISCLICHTSKGSQLVQELSNTSDFFPIPPADAIRNNGGLVSKTESIPPERTEMLTLLKKHNVTPVVRRFVYSCGGRKRHLKLFGFKLTLPECLYVLMRTIYQRARKH